MKFRTFMVLIAAAGLLAELSAASALAAERSIRDIQKALADNGFNPGTPDGIWGKKSITALRAFQTVNGLPRTGTIDKATIDSLFPTPLLPVTESGTRGHTIPLIEAKPLEPVSNLTRTTLAPDTQTKGVENSVTPQQAPPADQSGDKPTIAETTTRETVSPRQSPASSSGTGQLWTFALIGLAAFSVMMFRGRRKRSASEEGLANTVSDSGFALGSVSDGDARIVLTEQAASQQKLPPASPSGHSASIKAHNQKVADWVKANTAKSTPLYDESSVSLAETPGRAQRSLVGHAATPSPSGTLLNFHCPPTTETKPLQAATSDDESASPKPVSPAQSSGRSASLEAHNKKVVEWVKTNTAKSRCMSDESNDGMAEIAERDPKLFVDHASIPSPPRSVLNLPLLPTTETELVLPDTSNNKSARPKPVAPAEFSGRPASLEAHNKSVIDWVKTNTTKARSISDESNDDLVEITELGQKPIAGYVPIPSPLNFPRPLTTETKAVLPAAGDDEFAVTIAGAEWIMPGKPVTIASVSISGGMFYLGSSLAKKGKLNENENCLVNPALTVGKRLDPEGISMGYWPSYAGMSTDARRSYLEWLAGSRSNPNDYIGYVFLYFYGLERRLLLDSNASDSEAVMTEVRRLLDVYGHNGSFTRYATELLTAAELRSGEPSAQFLAKVEPNGYEVPTAVKIALGIRVRDDCPIEADLMLRYALNHPETSVRTVAKRVPDLLRELYNLEFAKLYSSGYRPRGGRTKKLKKHYHACSGSFNLEIKVLGGDIPDITDREEPIRIARRVLNDCMEQLDDYSRTLGRLPGLVPNLMAIARLPESVRLTAARSLPGDPFANIRNLADNLAETRISYLADYFGLDIGINPGKAKLRDLSQALSSFGIGATFDPAFAVKSSASDDRVVLFPISQLQPPEATEAYRTKQLSIMLGMIVGHADGEFHELERKALLDQIAAASDLSIDEKQRLEAEIRLNGDDATRLDEWLKRLKGVPESALEAIASELVSLASADGNLHADEVRKLEVIFKRIGIDHKSLYDRLHAGAGVTRAADSNADMSAKATQSMDSSPRTRIDLLRLQNIRSETRVTFNVLADIFVDEEEEAPVGTPEPVPGMQQSEFFEGLEQRYGAFLSEILQRSPWSKEDFEHLARDASLMPGAAKEAINDWALNRFDELMIEGEDELEVNGYLLPATLTISAVIKESMPA